MGASCSWRTGEVLELNKDEGRNPTRSIKVLMNMVVASAARSSSTAGMVAAS
jgi:hypothetical protein